MNKNKAKKELKSVFSENSSANWDGYNALPISRAAYEEAKKLLTMIPSSFSMPDILPEPDGSIDFVWYEENVFSFSISIAGNGVLSCAGLFGENTFHGNITLAIEEKHG